MNGDFELATKLIEVFRSESERAFIERGDLNLANSYERIADSIQQLLDEHNPPKKDTDRDV